MPVIQASEKYFLDVVFLLRSSVRDMNRKNMFHWNTSYPSVDTIREDISTGTLYICKEKGICQGMIVINNSQSEEYQDIKWKTRSENVLIVHRLAVNPIFHGKGIGKKLTEFTIQYGQEKGFSAVRLDVINSNREANHMYLEMGFNKTGSFQFPFQKTQFICYELPIND